MFKRHFPNTFVAAFFLAACTFFCIVAPMLSHASGPGTQFITMPGLDELQNDSTQWNIFHDQGYTKGRLQNIQPEKGTMKVTLMNGKQSYADILAYRDLPAVDGATRFMMDVSFLFHTTSACGSHAVSTAVEERGVPCGGVMG